MKPSITILVICLLGLHASRINAQGLTTEERRSGTRYLTESRDFFLTEVKGLSDAQLDFKTAPERWSIRQCMEHIALSESFIFQLVQKLVSQPANPEKKAEAKFTDDQLMAGIVDRSKKGKAPEPIQPHGEFKSASAAIEAFTNQRNNHIAYIENTSDDLRSHLSPHPFFGLLDGYQWLLLIGGHSRRHTLQIQEVKASPGFPKS
jgi:hypothetical protein